MKDIVIPINIVVWDVDVCSLNCPYMDKYKYTSTPKANCKLFNCNLIFEEDRGLFHTSDNIFYRCDKCISAT